MELHSFYWFSGAFSWSIYFILCSLEFHWFFRYSRLFYINYHHAFILLGRSTCCAWNVCHWFIFILYFSNQKQFPKLFQEESHVRQKDDINAFARTYIKNGEERIAFNKLKLSFKFLLLLFIFTYILLLFFYNE